MGVYLAAIDSIIETKRAEAIGQFDLFSDITVSQVSGLDLDIPLESGISRSC